MWGNTYFWIGYNLLLVAGILFFNNYPCMDPGYERGIQTYFLCYPLSILGFIAFYYHKMYVRYLITTSLAIMCVSGWYISLSLVCREDWYYLGLTTFWLGIAHLILSILLRMVKISLLTLPMIHVGMIASVLSMTYVQFVPKCENPDCQHLYSVFLLGATLIYLGVTYEVMKEYIELNYGTI